MCDYICQHFENGKERSKPGSALLSQQLIEFKMYTLKLVNNEL